MINSKRGIIIKTLPPDTFGGVNWCGYEIVDERVDFKTDVRMFKVRHSELPIVREGECYEEYWLGTAKIRFPWLFKNTNPLLYREFYSRKSWKVLELEREYDDIYNILFLR